jgi:hypothetical protein
MIRRYDITFVLSYFRTKVLSKVLSYFIMIVYERRYEYTYSSTKVHVVVLRKYESTKVSFYLRTKVRVVVLSYNLSIPIKNVQQQLIYSTVSQLIPYGDKLYVYTVHVHTAVQCTAVHRSAVHCPTVHTRQLILACR